MSHSSISPQSILLISLLYAALIIHNCYGDLNDENHKIECNQVECSERCPSDSYTGSLFKDHSNDDDDNNNDDDDDDDDDDYDDYNLYDPLRFHFDEATNLEDSFDVLNESVSFEMDADSTNHSRMLRSLNMESNLTECCSQEKCVCKKCKDLPQCPAGEVAVLVHEGQGIPGNCCSIFECKKHEKCSEDNPPNQIYFQTKCIQCHCLGKMEMCYNYCKETEILQNCYSDYLHKPIMNGGRWMEGPCMSCTCKQGEKRCIISTCPKLLCDNYITSKDSCCPICKDPMVYHDNTTNTEALGNNTAMEIPLTSTIEPDATPENSTEYPTTSTIGSVNAMEEHPMPSVTHNPLNLAPTTIATNRPLMTTTLIDLNESPTTEHVLTTKATPKNDDANDDLTEMPTTVLATTDLFSLNTTSQTMYDTTTPSVTPSTNKVHNNKTLNVKENDKHFILINNLNIIIIVGVLLLAIAAIILGLLIRFLRNRKKMYSCIPSSETSLGQNSTNPMLAI